MVKNIFDSIDFNKGADQETLYGFYSRLLSDRKKYGWGKGKPHWTDNIGK